MDITPKNMGEEAQNWRKEHIYQTNRPCEDLPHHPARQIERAQQLLFAFFFFLSFIYLFGKFLIVK